MLQERKRRKLQPADIGLQPADIELQPAELQPADIAACKAEPASYRIGRYSLRRIPGLDLAGDEPELELQYFCGNEETVWEGTWPKDLQSLEHLCAEKFKLEKEDLLFIEHIHSVARQIVDDEDYQHAKENQNSPLRITSRTQQDMLHKRDSESGIFLDDSDDSLIHDLVGPVREEWKRRKLQRLDDPMSEDLIAKFIAGMIVEQLGNHAQMTKQQWIQKGINDYNRYYNSHHPDYDPSCHKTATPVPFTEFIATLEQEPELAPALLRPDPPPLGIEANPEADNSNMPRAKGDRFQQAQKLVNQSKRFKGDMNHDAFFVTFHHRAETDNLRKQIEAQGKQIEAQGKQIEAEDKQIEALCHYAKNLKWNFQYSWKLKNTKKIIKEY